MRTLIFGIAAMSLGVTVSAQAQIVDFRNSSNSPHIYSPRGEYLGNLNNNQFDPNSVSNQFGAGSQFRANGVLIRKLASIWTRAESSIERPRQACLV